MLEYYFSRRKIRAALLARDDSGSLIGEIVLNPERDETERLSRLHETWQSRNFAKDVETKVKAFIEQNKHDLPCYKI